MLLKAKASVIVVTNDNHKTTLFSTLTCACEMYHLPYHTVKSLKFPFFHRQGPDALREKNMVLKFEKLPLWSGMMQAKPTK
jgi:hypothetical protein